jgi:hypothetical protein
MISEGASKLASVPSGGSGGGAAPAATGGAAAGGAAAEEEKKEEKEEGMSSESPANQYAMMQPLIFCFYREGRVRRGYGFRSFRLSGCYSKSTLAITYKAWPILSKSFREKLCELNGVLRGRNLASRDKPHKSTLCHLWHQLDPSMRRASSTSYFVTRAYL